MFTPASHSHVPAPANTPTIFAPMSTTNAMTLPVQSTTADSAPTSAPISTLATFAMTPISGASTFDDSHARMFAAIFTTSAMTRNAPMTMLIAANRVAPITIAMTFSTGSSTGASAWISPHTACAISQNAPNSAWPTSTSDANTERAVSQIAPPSDAPSSCTTVHSD